VSIEEFNSFWSWVCAEGHPDVNDAEEEEELALSLHEMLLTCRRKAAYIQGVPEALERFREAVSQ
jgi:hypothetical protein